MATIQGVYVALFGRPADPTGLAYFNSITNNGANLAGISNLAGQKEYTDRFTGMNNVQIVNSIYQSLFGRPAELAGLNFFADALAKGTLSINNIAIAILDGAQGNDKTVVTNKVAAADLYTKALDTGPEVVAYSGSVAAAQGAAFISGVSTTVPTQAQVDASVANMVSVSAGGGGTAGVTLTLTVGADTVSPDQTTVAFKSTANDDTIRANITANSLETLDSIDGGGGVDTLNVSLSASAGVRPVLKNVETINVTELVAATPSSLDLTDATGVKAVWNVASAGDLTVSNVALTTTVGLTGAIGDVATFSFAGATGSNDTATLAVKEAVVTAGSAVTIAAIENLNVQVSNDTSTATNISTIDSLVAVNTKNIVVTGEVGTLTVGGNAANDLTALTKFDASGLKGDLVLNLETGTSPTGGVAVSGSNGVNQITLDTTAVGVQDSIVYSSANVSTISKMTTVTNFNFSTDKLDVKAFALGADTTVGSTGVSPAGDISGFFSGTARVMLNDTTDVVYVDVNKDGNFNAGTDLAVTLTGATAATFTASDLILA